MMAWAGREFAIAHGAQLARQRLLGDRDAKLLPDPLDQVDQAPAHNTVNRRDRTIIKPCHESRSMGVAQLRGRARRLAVNQALGSVRVELHHPVPHDLQGHPANPGGLSPGRSVVIAAKAKRRRVCGPSFAWRAITRSARASKSARSGTGMANSPTFATLNQTHPMRSTKRQRTTP